MQHVAKVGQKAWSERDGWNMRDNNGFSERLRIRVPRADYK